MKNLLEATVEVDGAAGGETAAVVATAQHPFWVDDQARWFDSGQWKPAPSFAPTPGTTSESWPSPPSTELRRDYKLTINGIHTYHVGRSQSSCPQ